MFVFGVDLGQAQDFTAIAVIEKVKREETLVRSVKRVPLGTAYVTIADMLVAATSKPEVKGRYLIAADATGCGRPVMEMFRAKNLRVSPVIITSGGEERNEGWFSYIPKRDLISKLQVELQSGRLKFAEGMPELKTLLKELQSFKVKVTDAGNDTYGNDRSGEHDDMVLALALGVAKIGTAFANHEMLRAQFGRLDDDDHPDAWVRLN